MLQLQLDYGRGRVKVSWGLEEDLTQGGYIGISALKQERENLDWGIGDEKKWLNFWVYFEGEADWFPNVFKWEWEKK